MNKDHNPLTISAILDLTPHQIVELHLNINIDPETKRFAPRLRENEQVGPKKRFYDYYRSIGIVNKAFVDSEWKKEHGKKQK